MFEKIKDLFRKGGAKIGMVKELGSIIEHDRISMTKTEYQRIKENMKIYQSEYRPVEYIDSNGERQTRNFHSMNVSKTVSRKLAKLVFNEGVKISINNDAEADKYINEVFQKSKFRKNFSEELEAGYAVGGLVLRPYFDTSTKQIKISYSKPDSFFPLSSSSNDISEMAFTTTNIEIENKKTVYYTLLEFHLWEQGTYVIENELWRSEAKGKLGIKVPLDRLSKYEGLRPRTAMQGFSRPLFVYVKLAGKNNKNVYSPLSLGIIDNSKEQIKDINEKYDQFMWEVKQSERKIIASDHFFKTRFDHNGRPIRQFDSKTSAYRTIRSDEPTISEFVPQLRTTEFVDTIDFILRVIEMQTGFSTGTFSFDGKSVKTATEVISENSETYATRSDNVLIIEEAMKELITSIFELSAFYHVRMKPKKLDITIDFDDGVFQSKESKLDYYSKNTTLQLMPRYMAIMNIHGVNEETAVNWVKAIQREQMGLDPIEQQAQQEEEQFGARE